MTQERIADDLLRGAKEIAEETGIDQRQIYRLHERRLLPTFRVGGIICARRSELAKALSSETAAERDAEAA